MSILMTTTLDPKEDERTRAPPLHKITSTISLSRELLVLRELDGMRDEMGFSPLYSKPGSHEFTPYDLDRPSSHLEDVD